MNEHRPPDSTGFPRSEVRDLSFLVVEDHGFQRWMLRNMLSVLGATKVEEASDGAQALQVLADASFDVVICDLDMPGMDGMEFIRHLGEMSMQASLVVCTAMDDLVIGSVEAMAGAYGVRLLGTIRKPASPAKLQALIERRETTLASKPHVSASFSAKEIVAAIARGEFEAFYQPKVSILDGTVVGAEALARWRHPHRGLLGPDAFVPTLEAEGRIDDLTEAILRDALSSCRRWRDNGSQATVAVNLSLRSLSDPHLVNRLLDRIDRHRVEPAMVVFEITESAEAENLGRSLENLSRLRIKGFGLSIDDYGTGYSSLLQLSRVPFTELKIDRGFVRHALRSTSHRALLETSLDLTRRLRISAVAEGVETAQEWDLLRKLDCPVAQGYFICEPKPRDAFEGWLDRRSRAASTGTLPAS